MYLERHGCQNSLNYFENKNKVKENLSGIKVYYIATKRGIDRGLAT